MLLKLFRQISILDAKNLIKRVILISIPVFTSFFLNFTACSYCKARKNLAQGVLKLANLLGLCLEPKTEKVAWNFRTTKIDTALTFFLKQLLENLFY